ncbi:MAG: hypothetical protein PW792_17595 [Acidobacteriaceae bacterium]|nr:hypothetical protein [Acidobacteriaceae bacterium]
MESSALPTSRRTEDIALDLLKFVASQANLGRTASTPTRGFAPAAETKSEDPVDALLELYARCREAVEK